MDKAVAQLTNIRVQLKWAAQSLFYASLTNLVGTALVVIIVRVVGEHGKFGLLAPSLSGIALLFAGPFAMRFETRRKLGDVYFKELSDEIQAQRRFAESSPAGRPKLSARIALRSFAETADLPLIPGKYGPVSYILINLAVWLAALIWAL